MAPISLYDVTIPALIHTLTSLSTILQKAADTASSKSLDLATLPATRLAEDMLPLTFQIQTACNSAKFVAVRVGGVPNDPVPDDEKTMEDMQARVKKTIEFLHQATREGFEGAETKEVTMRDMKFNALDYVTKFAMPNFYFHVVTAYAILRMKGVEIGKMDYLGKLQ